MHFPWRRLSALLVVLLAALFVRLIGGEFETRSTAFALGFALIAAAVAGVLIERLQMPKVTGYLLFGMVCGPYLANIISRPMARELQLFNGLAVVLITFIAGLEINLARLRPRLLGMMRVGGINVLVTNLGFFLVFWLAWPWLPILPSASGVVRVSLAILSAIVVSCSSPSVAMAVIAETRSAGRLSELVVAVVILADLALILLFTLAMQAVRAAVGASAQGAEDEVALLARLSWQFFGSFAFGAALGTVFALYLHYVGREVAIVLVALCAVISQVGSHLHFEPILAGLAAGLVVENIAPPDGDALKLGVEQSALPILIVFFVAAGASLQLDALAEFGAIAALISIARMALMRTGTRLGAKVAGVPPPVDGLIWMGLVAQAGVTLGLVTLVAREFPDWGARLQTLVVALIALHQLVGPVLFRSALARAGEIGRATAPSPAGVLESPAASPAR